MAQKVQYTIYLTPEVAAAMESEKFGDVISTAVERRLRQALKMGPAEREVRTPLEAAELSKKETEAEIAKRKLAIMAGEFVRRDAAFLLVQRDHATIRSRMKVVPTAILGLTPEQYADAVKAVEDAFTDLSAMRPDAWDDLADEAAQAI